MKKEKEKNLLSVEAEAGLSPNVRYACRLHRFHRFYWTLVTVAGIVCALSVVIAVIANVLVGLCLAVCTAVIYHHSKKCALSRMLGLVCTATENGLCIQSASAMGEETLYLPTHLMGMRVRALGSTPFACKGNDALKTVCFFGSRKEWDGIAAACELSDLTVLCDVPCPDVSALTDAPTESMETEVDA